HVGGRIIRAVQPAEAQPVLCPAQVRGSFLQSHHLGVAVQQGGGVARRSTQGAAQFLGHFLAQGVHPRVALVQGALLCGDGGGFGGRGRGLGGLGAGGVAGSGLVRAVLVGRVLLRAVLVGRILLRAVLVGRILLRAALVRGGLLTVLLFVGRA